MTNPHPEPSPTARRIADSLAAYLGPHTARVAVRTFAQRALGHGAEAVTSAEAQALLDALAPMLRAFVGRERTAALLERIQRQVHVRPRRGDQSRQEREREQESAHRDLLDACFEA